MAAGHYLLRLAAVEEEAERRSPVFVIDAYPGIHHQLFRRAGKTAYANVVEGGVERVAEADLGNLRSARIGGNIVAQKMEDLGIQAPFPAEIIFRNLHDLQGSSVRKSQILHPGQAGGVVSWAASTFLG